jgi:N-acetylglucosaminyldiphosphoundecaprenol N-acetyl-beta-D-mannosaminyltransferase
MSLLVNSIINTNKLDCQDIFSVQRRVYTFLNPVSYLDALKHKSLFNEFDGIFADGGLLVKAINGLYRQNVKRWSFDMGSMAPVIFNEAIRLKKSIAIVATKQDILNIAIKTLKDTYPELNISYFRNGYFKSERDIDVEAQKIVGLHPDILIVGMGIIKQEEFLLKVKHAGFKGIGFTCGGFIHQLAQNKKDYYPKWINEHGLRFVYRMYKEPHTRKRYAKAAFLFPVRFLFEKLTGK